MLLDTTIRRISAKELTLFFASPMAYLFLGAFAAVTLFVFFWGETFFARNIADLRPLFEWMPILLLFLTSALTMRVWSEERRNGTLEHVLTQPLPIWRFVLAKFFACFALLALALAITLPLPITVALIGDLDWGPVWSGYLATLLLGGAYLAIGLFVSARSDNQIVSLISATALCGLLYLVGAPAITDFVGYRAGEWLRLLGTGARFDDITRGVIDLRDLAYFLSLIAIFLTLNTLGLERERWALTGDRGHHRRWRWGAGLLIANAVALNLWLGQVQALRIDTTEGRLYSISEATRGYLAQLREPLLIRGYFSAQTHPLLSPLVPRMRDLVREYEVAGRGRVRVEFIDPLSDPLLEEQANQRYGIEPVPFRVTDRHQAALVNSYFNLLIQYGDQHEVLGFRDLIEVQVQGAGDVEVRLRNPEYDITRALKKVLLAYQSGGNLFETVAGDLRFTAYVSADDRLPAELVEFKQEMREVLDRVGAEAEGRLVSEFIDPDAEGGRVAAEIRQNYGFTPLTASLFDSRQFHFHLLLGNDDMVAQIPLGDLSASGFELALEAGIKRFSSGFTRSVALVTPAVDPRLAQAGLGGPTFRQLEQFLGAELNVRREDLADGGVDEEADILLLAAPEKLDDRALFAIDQFLMRGGTLVAATSPFSASLTAERLGLQRRDSGLADWLAHHGIGIEEQLVLDPQNSAFPLPVTRQVGQLRFRDLRMLEYPYFPDLRGDGLNADHPITSGLRQMSMAWASPITIDAEANAGREVIELLHSSPEAWLSSSTDVMPRIDAEGRSPAYQPGSEVGRQLLGAIVQGRFASYFAGRESPLLAATDGDGEGDVDAERQQVVSGVIERSADSARIILFSSNDFIDDRVIQLAGAAAGGDYQNSQQLIANSIDWAVEDQNLLAIRARGNFNRTLPPLDDSQRLIWESINYGMAVFLLLALAAAQQAWRKSRARRFHEQLSV